MIDVKVDATAMTKSLQELAKKIATADVRGIEKAGTYLEGKMVQKVMSGLSPGLASATIQAKGSSKPLIDTGELIGQITSESSGKETKVGVIGSRAGIAQHHEFGAPAKNIPERSFIRSTFRKEKDKVLKIVGDEVKRV